jgi:hypothetical protein
MMSTEDWREAEARILAEPSEAAGDAGRRFDRDAAALASRARAGLSNPHLYRYLAWKYGGHQLLRRAGRVYPVAVFPAHPDQAGDVESALLELRDAAWLDEELSPRSALFRRLLERTAASGRPRDLATYTMTSLRTSDRGPVVACQRGTYFRGLETCDSLEWEILTAAAGLDASSETAFQRFDEGLTLRSALHAAVADPVTDGRHRSAHLSVSTLVVYRDEGRFFAWLAPRSESGVTAYRDGLLHVVPSFVFQPVGGTFQDEWSVRGQVYREYLEELFDRPEVTDAGQAGRGDLDPCLAMLLQLLDRGEATLSLTGVAVNLLNLRPEICTLLLVESPDWFRHHSERAAPSQRFRLNHEFGQGRDRRDAGSRVELALAGPDEMIEPVLEPHRLIPPAAAALWLGAGLARRLLRRGPAG